MAWGFGLRMTIWIFGPYKPGLRICTGLNAVDVFRYQIEGLGPTVLIGVVVRTASVMNQKTSTRTATRTAENGDMNAHSTHPTNEQ